MKMSEEVKKAVAENTPGLVATANREGKPKFSAHESLRVLDDDHLVFVDVRSPRTIANLKENPQVAVICINPATRKGCRIWGKAGVMASGDLFNQMSKEYAARNMKVNYVVTLVVEDAIAL